MVSEQQRRELPKALIRWYKIDKESKILCIVSEYGNSNLIAEALEERGLHVKRMSTIEEDTARYDFAVVVDVLEYVQNVEQMLRDIKSLLKPDGKLLLATDNRLGIRYFCGDQDIFTGKNFDGVENYSHLLPWEQEKRKGRAYAKAEWIRFLENVGFQNHRFFSVFPRISNPQLLLAEDYTPNEALDIRIFPEYNNPNTVFLMEEELYPTLMENQLLHTMANGFFIECPLNGDFSPVNQVTLSAERGSEQAMATIIRKDNMVEKYALYPAGKGKVRQLFSNQQYLSAHGVPMINSSIKEDTLVMPYIVGVPLNSYFRSLLEQDKAAFLQQLDKFWELILHSSDYASVDEINWEQFEPGWEKRKKDDPNRGKWKRIASGSSREREELGVILKRGYLDLVSLNCFYLNQSFLFYDQELYLENVPAKAILLRTIEFIYKFNEQLDHILSREELLMRYGLSTYQSLYQSFISYFLKILRNDDGLSDYFKEGRREYYVVQENRKRMNYSEEEYSLIFKDIFHQTKGRKLYLFGSGKYAKIFRERYGEVYPVSGYLDNEASRWGSEIDGVSVQNPAILREMNPAEYKVIICIRNYMPVMQQLRREGVPNFSVYNPNEIYRNDVYQEASNVRQDNKKMYQEDSSEKISKNYHVGYVAGVFDLFHIGHLNLFRRAKEQCDYLLVGVVTDEGVIKHKKSNPKIPFQERIELVRACRYVDEAVEIPLDQGDTDEAYRRYRFDVQFSGSDYADDPKWIAKKEFLQRHGSDLVFFPYTEGISTTELKDRIGADRDAEK